MAVTRRRRTSALLDSLQRRPVLTVAVVAAAVRVATALVSFVVNKQYLIGDELQYMQLGHVVASGHPADSWVPSYGQSLYHATWAFMAPLVFLFRFVYESRFVGQLYSVMWGVVTAVLATRLARELVRPAWALAAGLVVALLPSQVLWSSVVLRESEVWAALAATGVGVVLASRARGWSVLGWVALAAAGLLVLGYLRDQTMVICAWALALAALVGGGRRWWQRVTVSVGVAATFPILAGLGLFGWGLIAKAAPSLGATRTYMALDANSAFTPTTLLPSTTTSTTTTTAPRPRPNGGGDTPTTIGSGAMAIAGRSSEKVTDSSGTHWVIPTSSGAVYVSDEGVAANVRQLPRGFVATTLRPYPWESSGSIALSLARLENVLWYGLYVLAAIGVWFARRRLSVTAFPVLVIGGIIVAAALTQGNLGTAFRHRAQVLWAVAPLAAVAAQHLVDAAHARRKPLVATAEGERA